MKKEFKKVRFENDNAKGCSCRIGAKSERPPATALTFRFFTHAESPELVGQSFDPMHSHLAELLNGKIIVKIVSHMNIQVLLPP